MPAGLGAVPQELRGEHNSRNQQHGEDALGIEMGEIQGHRMRGRRILGPLSRRGTRKEEGDQDIGISVQ